MLSCSSDGGIEPIAATPNAEAGPRAPGEPSANAPAPDVTASGTPDAEASNAPEVSGSAAVERALETGIVRDGRCIPRRVKTHAPPSKADAIGSFQRAWEGCVARTSAGTTASFTTESMRKREHPFVVSKEACRAMKQRIDQLLDGLSPTLIVFGSTAALDMEGDCWAVSYQGGMKNEVGGVLDARSLDLLFAWRIPEG